MINNHSAAFYTLAMNARFKMIDFDTVKEHKKLGCVYSSGKKLHFKKIYINTELSPAFRFEKWIGDTYYCIELMIVSYVLNSSRVKSFNIDFKITKCENNIYTEHSGSINDDLNFPAKDGRWTDNYMVEYGYNVFEFYKELILESLVSQNLRTRYLRIYDEIFIENSY